MRILAQDGIVGGFFGMIKKSVCPKLILVSNKIPSLPSCLIAVLTTAVLILSGCGQTPSSPTPTPSTKPGLIGTLNPSATYVVDPNAPPAAYKLSNLRAEPSPENGDNYYYFYVDVENTGGQPGTFTAAYRIDSGIVENETKKISLNPGQKKQVQLIGPQMEIKMLGNAYDQGVIDQRQHVILCGDLILPVTLAEHPSLMLIDQKDDSTGGNITVAGDVKNTGNTTFEHVIAVVSIRVTDQKIMWIYKMPEAPVDFQPLTPGKITSFKIVTPDDLPGNLSYVDYLITFKDAPGAAGLKIRTANGTTSTQ